MGAGTVRATRTYEYATEAGIFDEVSREAQGALL